MLFSYETLLVGYFIYVIVIAHLLPATRLARRRVLAVNVSILAAYTALVLSRPHLHWVSVVRDWVALGLTILCYEEMGWLAPSSHRYRLEKSWIVWDRRFLNDWHVKAAIERCGWPVAAVLELSYTFVYVMPVVGLVLLYIYGRADLSDQFLRLFLLATLSSYALFPYFPSEPPRTAFPADNLPRVNTAFRKFNLWMLDRTGIHTSVFPSAHVSGAFGVAFAILRILPDDRGAGWCLLVLACSITIATVYGRYHYLVDALAGIGMSLLALVVAIAWERLF